MSTAKRPDRRGWLSSVRHPARRDGIVALAFFLLPWLFALGLERRDRHLDGGAIAILVSVSLGLPVLWLTWVLVRDSRAGHGAGEQRLGEVADQLAVAVRAQWEAEAAIRRLNDPYPLPVSWVAADAGLADDWGVLVTLATSGAGWSAPAAGAREHWAGGPGELAGTGNQFARVLDQVPTRRLVVLGEPGSGKTMLMVRLVLDLLAGRAGGGPVPVLVPLASWDPASQGLRDWLVGRLVVDYPALSLARPGAASLASRLLEARMIMPVLDGLDEMPGDARRRAVAAISGDLRPGEPAIVTCRAAEYQTAVLPPGGSGMTVHGAAVVSLEPLDAGVVGDYLRQGGGPAVAGRWQPVLAGLAAGTPVGQALATPLMAGLAHAIYNPRSGERADQLPDPAELCHLTDKNAVQAHLFDAFIPAAYRHQPGARWSAEKAGHWLTFLAWHLERTVKSPDLAWWQLRLTNPRVAGLAAGLMLWLPAVPRDLTEAASPAAVLGRERRQTTDLNWWEIRDAAPRLLPGLSVGLLAGLAGALGLSVGAGVGVALTAAVTVALVARGWNRPAPGFAPGLAGGLIGGLAGALAGHAVVAGHLGSLLAVGLASGIAVGALGGFRAGLAGGLAGGYAGALAAFLDVGPAGHLINGLGLGLAAGCTAGLAQRRRPARRLRWSSRGLVLGAGVGLVLGFAVWLQVGLISGLITGLLTAAGGGLVTGLEVASPDPTAAAGPGEVLSRDRATFWITALAAGLATGLGTGCAVGLPAGLRLGIEVGLANAVAVGLAVGFVQAAYGGYTLARCWLAIRGSLPWQLMAFLSDAHQERGVLRQSGATYQFRHEKLQSRLASRP